MDAILKRKVEGIYLDVVQQYTQEQIDQVSRWVAMALAKAAEKVPLNEAKVFLMTIVRDCPSEMVELAREVEMLEVTAEVKH